MHSCFLRTHEFFDFPIEFLWGLSTIAGTIQVLCAAFRAALTPSYTIRVAWKSKNDETQYKCMKRFFMGRVCKSWALLQARAKLSCFFINFCKTKMQQKCQRKLSKLSSRSNQNSTFAMFWGPKMSLPNHSEREHDSNIFPKMRNAFTKKFDHKF